MYKLSVPHLCVGGGRGGERERERGGEGGRRDGERERQIEIGWREVITSNTKLILLTVCRPSSMLAFKSTVVMHVSVFISTQDKHKEAVWLVKV
jgi:hypothetical protein